LTIRALVGVIVIGWWAFVEIAIGEIEQQAESGGVPLIRDVLVEYPCDYHERFTLWGRPSSIGRDAPPYRDIREQLEVIQETSVLAIRKASLLDGISDSAPKDVRANVQCWRLSRYYVATGTSLHMAETGLITV
jgi:hypothetical protein